MPWAPPEVSREETPSSWSPPEVSGWIPPEVADSPEGEVEINTSIREMPDLQATTRGGGRAAIPDAGVALATFGESVREGFGEVVAHPGVELPKLGITPERVQQSWDAVRYALGSDYDEGAGPPGVAAKAVSGGLEGVEELVGGVANFFTSGPGMIQLGVAATPLAPAVYAKWTVDMLNAGFTSVEEAWDAFQKSDWRNASKNAAIAFGSFLGAGAAAKHGFKELTPLIDAVPRGDLQGVRVEEAQRKALEATMPRSDKVAPVEVEILRESGAPITARVVEQISKEQAEGGLREAIPEAPEAADIRGLAQAPVQRITAAVAESGLRETVPNERAVQAAVRINGEIATGVEHADAIGKWAKERGVPVDDVWSGKVGEIESGFLTDAGNFVDADQASIMNNPRRYGTVSHAAEITPAPTPKPEAPGKVADELTPALRTSTGEIISGEKGKVHNDIYKSRGELEGNMLRLEQPEHGFIRGGKFLTREEASALVGEKTPLQSERLIELQSKPESTAPPAPTPEPKTSPSEAGTKIGEMPKQRWDELTETLADNSDTFHPARNTGGRDYDLIDTIQEFMDFSRAKAADQTLWDALKQFEQESSRPTTHFRKLRSVIKEAGFKPEKTSRIPEPKTPAAVSPEAAAGNVPTPEPIPKTSGGKTKPELVEDLLGKKPSQSFANVEARVRWDKDAKELSKRTKSELEKMASERLESEAKETNLANSTRQIMPEIDALAKSGGQRWRTVLREKANAEGAAFPTAQGMTRGDVVYYVSRAIAEKRMRRSTEAPTPKTISEKLAPEEGAVGPGMGAAIPEEFKPSQQMPTANKNASIDKDRVARGETPLVSAMRKSDPELFDQAMAVIDNDWTAADKLIARHKAEPFVPTDVDTIVLLQRRVDLNNELAKLSREQATATQEGRPEMAEAARASRDFILDQLRELEIIIGKGDTMMGTMTGRALRARRLVMNEDYSMGSLIVNREISLNRRLTPEEVVELETISQEQAKVSEQLAKKEAEIEARAQELEARAIAERASKEQQFSPFVLKLAEEIVKSWDARADRARARLKEKWKRTSTGLDPTILVDLSEIGVSHLAHAGLDFAKWSARMVEDLGEFAEKAKPYFEKAFERAKKLSEDDKVKRAGPKKAEVDAAIARTAPATAIEGIVTRLAKRFAKNPKLDFSHPARTLARYFYEQGIRKPLELVDAVHGELVKAMPELTKRETMDALSGYGRFAPLRKDAISAGLRDVNGQLQQIAKLEDMAQGKAPLKTGFERRTPSDEERRLIKQVEEKKKEGGYDVTDPETQLRTAREAYGRRLENQIKDMDHEIQTRTKTIKNKRKLELDDKLRELRDKRDFMREVWREVFAPEPLTEAQRLAKWKELTRDKIEDYKERLMARDFQPRKRPVTPRLDPEAIKLRYELHKVHNALMEMRLRDQLKQRGQARKIVDGVANVIRFSRAVMTGGEFSAVLRQGGFTAFSHPILSAKALKPMFQAFMSEKNQFKINEEIQTRPNAPLYERNKLQFTESGVRLSSMEEHYMFRVSERIGRNPLAKYPLKAVAAFQRAYVTYLNKIRADSFDALLDVYGDAPEMQKQIANLINVATGRGSSAVGKYVGPGANAVFFAPRYSISRLQLLTGQPAWGGNAATRKMVAQEYGRALAGAAVVYSLGMMAGGTVEDDPRHPDFGKIKMGNTRIDPLFGLAQWTRLLAAEISGERKTSKGREIPIRGKVPFGQPTGADVAFNFARTKLSPTVGASVSLAAGKDPVGKKFTLEDALIQSFVPITYGDILKAMEEQGVEKGAAIAVLALFGMGVQTYDADAKRQE